MYEEDYFDWSDQTNLLDNKNNNMLDLLKSPRFWGVVITSASVVLVDPSFPTTMWYISLAKFLGLVSAGTLGIRTIDRLGDKKVESAQITTGIPIDPPSSPSI